MELAPCLAGISSWRKSAPSHNGITVGCWASSGQNPSASSW